MQTIRSGSDLSRPYHFFLNLDLNLNYYDRLDSGIVKHSGGIENVKVLAEGIKQFAAESGFYKFYNDHNSFYQLIMDHVKVNFKDLDEKNRIGKIYGIKKSL